MVEVADGAGVSWPTAHAAFASHAETWTWQTRRRSRCWASTRPAAASPRWTRDTDSGRWVRTDPWDTGFVDLCGDQGLLGRRTHRRSANG